MSEGDPPRAFLELRSRAMMWCSYSFMAIPLAVLLTWIGIDALVESFDPSVATTHEPSLGDQVLAGVSSAFAIVFILGGIYLFWKWHLRFDCPYCGKSLSTAEPWRCGRCGTDNTPHLFWLATVASWCSRCWNKSHTMQCPHCRGMIDLVQNPDRRHPALFLNVAPILPAPESAPESVGEAEARRKREQEAHLQTIQALEQQTQVIEAQVRRAMAESKLSRYGQKEGEAAVAAMMKEIHGSFNRSEALLKFHKLKAEEINTSGTHSDDEKEALVEELDELVQVAKAKYL